MELTNTLHRVVEFIVSDTDKIMDNDRKPTHDEIETAWVYAVENGVVVQLVWYCHYSGWHSCMITDKTDINTLYETIKNQAYPV